MRLTAFATAISALAAASTLTPPGVAPPARHVSSFHYDGILGTSLDMKFVATSPNGATRAEAVALAEVERLRRLLSSWDSTSEVSRLFARGVLDHPSPELVTVLRQYTQWNERTGRAYSARVGELTALWQQAAKSDALPDSAVLANTVRDIAQPAWRIEASGRIVALTSHRIDLNSLGKGFIIDHAVQTVRDSVPGLRGALINIGGDVHVWGEPPADAAWHVAVANPADHADNAVPLARLSLRSGAVSSSGDYQRGFTIAGRRYSHIFDPRSGYPVDHISGVTVIAPDNATANALATTLSVLSPKDGIALVRGVRGADAMIVTASGEVLRTPGFASHEERIPSPAPAARAPQFTAKLAVDVTPTVRNRHAPFVAVWITDTAGHHVRTLAFWGDKPKYQRELSRWWGAYHTDAQLVDAVTRATRPAGKYSLDWDGLDQSGAVVPAGAYIFWLEAAFEDGAHSSKNVAITCGPAHAAGLIPSAAAFTGAEITCDPTPP